MSSLGLTRRWLAAWFVVVAILGAGSGAAYAAIAHRVAEAKISAYATTKPAPAPRQLGARTNAVPPATNKPAANQPAANQPAGNPPAAEQPAANVAAPTLLDMRSVDLLKGARVRLPAGSTPCGAATLKFDRNGRTTVGGREYWLHGDGSVSFGDLTGDGHAELAVVVTCSKGQVLVVLGATGPQTYATIASAEMVGAKGPGGVQAKSALVSDRVLVTYNVHHPRAAASDVRTWRIRGGRLVLVHATAVPVDWRNATVTMPRLGACPAGRYTFRDGRTAGELGKPALVIRPDSTVYYADFDRNGVRDSVVQIACNVGNPSTEAVVALTPTGGQTGRALGLTGQAAPDVLESVEQYEVDGERVSVTIRQSPSTTGQDKYFTNAYRWINGAFKKVS
jgi:hypothetical protein